MQVQCIGEDVAEWGANNYFLSSMEMDLLNLVSKLPTKNTEWKAIQKNIGSVIQATGRRVQQRNSVERISNQQTY